MTTDVIFESPHVYKMHQTILEQKRLAELKIPFIHLVVMDLRNQAEKIKILKKELLLYLDLERVSTNKTNSQSNVRYSSIEKEIENAESAMRYLDLKIAYLFRVIQPLMNRVAFAENYLKNESTQSKISFLKNSFNQERYKQLYS